MSFWTSLLQTGRNLAAIPAAELNYEYPPLHHDAKMCSVICEIDRSGSYITFKKLKTPEKAIIPVTLYSMKRAGLDAADFTNPLNEKAEYIGSENYVQLLSAWSGYATDNKLPGSNDLAAVLSFVGDGSFQRLAKDAGINRGALVCFKIGEKESWKSEDLFRSWISFYGQEIENDPNIKKGLCMITGNEDVLVLKAPKAILQQHPNGKLISCNDHKGFTYRGILGDPEEAVSIGIEGCHNTHQGLKYVFSHGAVEIGNNDWLCVWSPAHPTMTCANELVYGQRAAEQKSEVTREEWNKSLYGSKTIQLDSTETVVTAIIGGATDGRLAVKYFEESNCSRFVERLNKWHEALSWELWNSEVKDNVPYYPCAHAIIAAAFGRPSANGKLEADDAIRSLWLNRLLAAETKDLPIPQAIVDALVKRASNAAVHSEFPLPITLAVLRKQYYDKTGIILSISDQEELQKDRSYLYGRLLAIYEKAEQDYLGLQRENRITQAKRLQYSYVNSPATYERVLARSYNTIWAKRLSKKRTKKYTTEIAAVKNALKGNKGGPLNAQYLFGYYSERKHQYTKQTKGDESQ